MVQDDGVNAPINHQRIIARLTAGLYPLYRAAIIPYEPLPETMLGEYTSPTPDLILFDDQTDQTPVIVEICQTRGAKGDLQKVISLIDGELYGIREGFVFNYKTQQWLRYRLGDGGVATNSSFSDVLQVDLSTFV
jgi:hypothetical protein